MDNTILLYNNALNLNLKQAMNDANDVLYNMQSLKQFQWSIDQIQKMKDGAQMQVNMAALALWRHLILDVDRIGITLFRNLIRKYYPLNDEKICRYENIRSIVSQPMIMPNGDRKFCKPPHLYYITNLSVYKRKGASFDIGGWKFALSHPDYISTISYSADFGKGEIFHEVESLDVFYNYPLNIVCEKNVYIDFTDKKQIIDPCYLSRNCYTKWGWELVQRLLEQGSHKYVKYLLQNDGFFAQMGINKISETLNHLQEIVGSSYEITKEMKSEVITRLERKGIALHSYLPISKEFIFQHQNELDWKVIQKNPRIQWDWELINLYLRKVKETISEDKWPQCLLGSKAMYEFVGNYLNDEILSDIEKLYNIV